MEEIDFTKKISSIEFDYNLAIDKASKLEDVAEKLKMCAARMENVLDASKCFWKGDAANEYFRRSQQCPDELKKASDNYYKTAATIRNIAKRLYDMEMRAVNIAKERTFRNDSY